MPFALRTLVGQGNHLLDVAEHFQPNTVLWAFHTIQQSSFCRGSAYSICTVVNTTSIHHLGSTSIYVTLSENGAR